MCGLAAIIIIHIDSLLLTGYLAFRQDIVHHSVIFADVPVVGDDAAMCFKVAPGSFFRGEQLGTGCAVVAIIVTGQRRNVTMAFILAGFCLGQIVPGASSRAA